MKLVITDTNVFIDLIQSGGLVYFFQLDYEICTTDLVLEEIKLPEQEQQLQIFQTNGKLTVLELTAFEIREAFELPTQCNLKRITDKSVLLKAIHLQCMVLSGDRDLGKECLRNGLEVHGSIWVVREIWLAGLAEANLLMSILEALGRNGRLPGEEMERLKSEITRTLEM